MNKHIIIGDGRKCLCGIFEGKPLHCSDIIKSIETIKRHGQSWDGGLLARLLESYIVDLGDAPDEPANAPHGSCGAKNDNRESANQ